MKDDSKVRLRQVITMLEMCGKEVGHIMNLEKDRQKDLKTCWDGCFSLADQIREVLDRSKL